MMIMIAFRAKRERRSSPETHAHRNSGSWPTLADHKRVYCHDEGAGGPWRPSSFDRIWRRFKNKQKIECRFHDLRHTHAIQLLKAGVHHMLVSERLGHANVGITLDTYSHVAPK